jgi:DtxR family Mn-dependent transcriptional regulator
MHFIQECPRAGENWLEHFEEYRRHGQNPQKCKAKMEDFACTLEERKQLLDKLDR